MVKRASCIVAAVGLLMAWGSLEVVQADDLTNWIKPAGFLTPALRAGQYSFQAGIELWDYSSRGRESGVQTSQSEWGDDETEYYFRNDKRTTDQWGLRSGLIYALTNDWVINTSLFVAPGQKYSDGFWETHNDSQSKSQSTSRLDHELSTNLTVAYRPTPLFECFLSGGYDRSFYATDDDSEFTSGSYLSGYALGGDSKSENYSLFIGFNIAK